MLNLAKVAILAVSNQIGHCTRFQLIFDGGTSTRLFDIHIAYVGKN